MSLVNNFPYLTTRDLANARRVCKAWSELIPQRHIDDGLHRLFNEKLRERKSVCPFPRDPLLDKMMYRLLVVNPGALLQSNGDKCGSINPKLSNFSECHCVKVMSRPSDGIDCRKLGLDSLLEFIKDTPLAKKKQLCICSIGSAKCFTELEYHARFVALGYQVNWVLADPYYMDKATHPIVAEFTDRIRDICPHSKVQAMCPYLQDLPGFLDRLKLKHPSMVPDIFLTIDLKRLCAHVMEAFNSYLKGLDRPIVYLDVDYLKRKEYEEVIPFVHIYFYHERTMRTIEPLKLYIKNVAKEAVKKNKSAQSLKSSPK